MPRPYTPMQGLTDYNPFMGQPEAVAQTAKLGASTENRDEGWYNQVRADAQMPMEWKMYFNTLRANTLRANQPQPITGLQNARQSNPYQSM